MMATPTSVEKSSTPTTGEGVPVDLLSEILVRLQVKSLLCCKLVSKPWLSLISNPNFIISHLKRTITTPGADETFLGYNTNDHSMGLLDLDSRELGAQLGFPFSRGDFSFEPHLELINSCNGIVCVSVFDCPREIELDFKWHSKNSDKINNPFTYLWNSATKQSKLIPSHNVRVVKSVAAIGFGFDPIGNDFKVVRVVFVASEPFSAEVYSANTDVWRTVEPRPSDYPYYENFDVCVNGVLCCLGYYGMMTFDLNKEVFACGIQLPAKPFDSHITVFNDCVAVITSTKNEYNHMINLWTLDDESCLCGGGVEASWTMMLSIGVELPVVCQVYDYFKRGDLLLKSEDGDWFLYNSDKKEARVLPVSNIIGQPVKYVESLVSIAGFKQVN